MSRSWAGTHGVPIRIDFCLDPTGYSVTWHVHVQHGFAPTVRYLPTQIAPTHRYKDRGPAPLGPMQKNATSFALCNQSDTT
jgi:hypothetical protein